MAAYLELYRSDELKKRIEAARSLLSSCAVCPRRCGVNRVDGKVGKCRTSHEAGERVSKKKLAYIMLSLQAKRCHNINLVSPTHVVPQILEALEVAVEAGLRLPLVYNTGGYDSVETLKILDGTVDIYMPDMKYGDEEIAKGLSGIENYPLVIKLMKFQIWRGEYQQQNFGKR